MALDDPAIASILNLSLRSGFGSTGSVFGSVFADFGSERAFGLYGGIAFALNDGTRSSISARHSDDGLAVATTLTRSEDAGIAGLDWQLRIAAGAGSNSQSLLVGYDAPGARFDASLRHDDGLRGTVGVDGAVVVAGGGVFFSQPIHDAFAIVDTGTPGVAVANENRPAGITGNSGKLLVANLRSHEANRIAINPEGLPIDAVIRETTMVVVPEQGGGVIARFDIDTAPMAAVLIIREADGSDVQVGSSVRLSGNDEQFVVGYDGIAYVTGLAASNTIVVTRPDGTRCSAAFTFAAVPGVLIEIPLQCGAA